MHTRRSSSISGGSRTRPCSSHPLASRGTCGNSVSATVECVRRRSIHRCGHAGHSQPGADDIVELFREFDSHGHKRNSDMVFDPYRRLHCIRKLVRQHDADRKRKHRCAHCREHIHVELLRPWWTSAGQRHCRCDTGACVATSYREPPRESVEHRSGQRFDAHMVVDRRNVLHCFGRMERKSGDERRRSINRCAECERDIYAQLYGRRWHCSEERFRYGTSGTHRHAERICRAHIQRTG